MANPVITNRDTADFVMFNPIYRDVANVTVPAGETLERGTIIGNIADGTATQKWDDDTVIVAGITAESFTNSTEADVEVKLRAMVSGEFDQGIVETITGVSMTDDVTMVVEVESADIDITTQTLGQLMTNAGLIPTFVQVNDELDNQ